MRLHEELNKAKNSTKIYSILTQNDKESAQKNYAKNFKKENQSLISDNFFWTYYTVTFCMNCGSYLYNFQYCKYKFFPLEQIYTYKLNMFGLTGISLFDCLTFLFS